MLVKRIVFRANLKTNEATPFDLSEHIPANATSYHLIYKGAYPTQSWSNAFVAEVYTSHGNAISLISMSAQEYTICVDIFYTL